MGGIALRAKFKKNGDSGLNDICERDGVKF